VPGDISSARNYRRSNARLITAGQPDEEQLAACAASGTEVVINLALHDDPRYSLPDERATVELHGMKYIHIPVQFSAPAEADLESFFNAMDEHEDRSVLVHCAANYRVAVFVALYHVVRQRSTEEAAFEFMRSVWEPDQVWSAFIDSVLARRRA
jgi:protein tyrosine phosphatase (PTP) superfamily phosphohydrolase (DUF442 family)